MSILGIILFMADNVENAEKKIEQNFFTKLAALVILLCLLAWPIVGLWNNTMPHLSRDALPRIDYWQSLQLCLLTFLTGRIIRV